MKAFWKSLAASAALLGLLTAPALAGGILCAPSPAANASGPRSWGGTNSPVPSGTTYLLNSAGCVWVPAQDYGYFVSQGFTSGPNSFSVSIKGLTAQSTTSNSPILPPYAVINSIVIQETAGQAVTGGIDIGIAGSSDQTIVAAYTVGASALIAIPQASILRYVFGTSGAASGTPSQQQVFFNAHTNWTDGATVNATIVYSLFGPF